MFTFAVMMKSLFIRGSILAVVILMDLYVFQAIKIMVDHRSIMLQRFVYMLFWGITVFSVVILIMTFFVDFHVWPKVFRQYTVGILGAIYLSKIVILPFLLIDDVIRGITWIFSFFSKEKATDAGIPISSGKGISRIRFLSYLGVFLAAIPFFSMIYGMFYGKYRYTTKKVNLNFPDLPEAFKGIKIVQFSDFHIGSFMDQGHVKKAIDLINAQGADLVFFTGDLVNDLASEVDEFKELLKQIHAPMGIYSILGNHDYGDYYQWENFEQKRANLEKLKKHHQDMGWRLLLNEHVEIVIQDQKISLIGVENWSAVGHFPKYGNLAKAMEGVKNEHFKILLSHDPSHWDAQVIADFPGIHLTLAGHTHGMQFGVEIPGFKWSPVQYVYPKWAGLYSNENQHLYVNRGLGFIGYPGRVGILPEITVFELLG